MPAGAILYRETRLDITPDHVLNINTAGNVTGSVFGTKVGRKRTHAEINHDEESFARNYLATEGSVFSRPLTKSPRSFLWRVLNERQILEIQCIDTVRPIKYAHEHKESELTFRIDFPAPIVRNGIAFADNEEKDALNVFVITETNDLYTFTFEHSLLVRNVVPADFDVQTTFKRFTSSSLSFRHPYRLVAASSRELFVSLHDGGLMRLERQPKESGANWRETFFSEGGWSGTLKGLIPFSRPQTIRFGSLELDSTTAVAIAKSPNGAHIWTMTLDYVVKAWSTRTGKTITQIDLLDDASSVEERKKTVRQIMSPEQGSILQIVDLPMLGRKGNETSMEHSGNYFLVVSSPKDHQIKFFAVSTTFSSVEGDGVRVQDLQPTARLIPPIDDLMNTNVWHLENFFVKPGSNWVGSELWVRARSGALCRTFLLEFDLLDDNGLPSDISDRWRDGWSTVDQSSRSIEQLKEIPAFNDLDIDPATTSQTSTEQWLAFLFFPHRFDEASLETALFVFDKGRETRTVNTKSIRAKESPLQERLADSVASRVTLRRYEESEQPDFEKYQQDLHTQWKTFFSILAHLYSRRLAAVGFALDIELGLPISIYAGFVAPIRTCSNFELLSSNDHLLEFTESEEHPLHEQIFSNEQETVQTRLLAVARQLRQCFSPISLKRLRSTAIARSLDSDLEIPGTESLRVLGECCGASREVSDDDFDALNATAEGFNGLGNLSDDDFLGVLECLELAPESIDTEEDVFQPRYGVKTSVTTVLEMLQESQITLLDLLLLTVFMSSELEASELHPDFRAEEIHDAIIRRIRDTELRLWLVGNVHHRSNAVSKEMTVATLYETMFLADWDSRPAKRDSSLPELLTTWSMRWTFGLVLSNWSGFTEHVMANLLKLKNRELAIDFLPFLTEHSWTSEYLKARLHLLTGEYASASFEFKKAAEELADSRYAASPAVQQILSAEESNYFGVNSSRYFQHVSMLFEKLKAFSYTADFASLALSRFGPEPDVDQSIAEIDMRKSKSGRLAGEAIDDAMEEIRLLQIKTTKDDIYSRLYNALVQTGRYGEAYETLLCMTNPAPQRAGLQTLLQICIKRDAIDSFLQLPISGDLAQEADSVLLAQVKGHSGSSSTYHRILFAFRSRRADYRGAAAILYEHLETLRHSHKNSTQDPEDETMIQVYVLLINTLACCGKDEGWLLADPVSGVHAPEARRKLVTLDDVRRDYSAELDRRSDMLQGRFPIVAGEGRVDVF